MERDGEEETLEMILEDNIIGLKVVLSYTISHEYNESLSTN